MASTTIRPSPFAAVLVLLVSACGSGGGGPPVVPGDPPPGPQHEPTIVQTIVLVREDRATGDTDIFLGDTAGGPLTPLTDTPTEREDMCAINHDGTVVAFRRAGGIVVADGVTERVAGAGAVGNPAIDWPRVWWTLDNESFAGFNADTDIALTLPAPPGSRSVDEISFQSARGSCSAALAPSEPSKIWLLENGLDWRMLQASPDGDEQFQSCLLGDWIVYSFRDGQSPLAGLRVADAPDGTITKTIRSGVAGLTRAGWCRGNRNTGPYAYAGYDLIYVKTAPGSAASIIARDVETDSEAYVYAGDDRFAFTDFKVALGTGYP